MKIIHIVEDFSFKSGGVRTVVKALNDNLLSKGFDSLILSESKEKEDAILLINGKDSIWRYSKDWKNKLSKTHSQKKIDCIHIHGVWMYPQYIAAVFAIRNKIPFIVSPHGMFEPWLWKKGGLKKKAYFNFLIKNKFKKATVLHAITNQEKENLETLFNQNNCVEIPNLINEKLVNSKNDKKPLFKEKYILFVGRLDPIKGLDLLIKAFAKIENEEVSLKIAGGFNSYKKELETIIRQEGIDSKRIEFLGFVKEKETLIKNAFIVVAPSYSEVVGMVNLEAAIHKTPVITTHQTGLNKLWDKNGGFLINPDVKELTSSLNKVLKWPHEERNLAGEKLCHFVSQNYTWKSRIKDWINLYNNILDGKNSN